MPDILTKIANYKRKEVAAAKREATLSELKSLISTQPQPRGFVYALKKTSQTGPALIAEIKKASPSKGLIRENFKPTEIARAYQDGGAACLSVLTDGPSFQGSILFLKQAKAISTLPILRKDFMVDPYQIYQSRAQGADAILIIMAMVNDNLARKLLKLATDLGMDALVETHDQYEMQRAIDIGATFIGINNRNLKTFVTSLKTFKTLAPYAPNEAFLVAESGIFTPNHILELTSSGAQAFLVGESLMREDDVKVATKKLLGRTK